MDFSKKSSDDCLALAHLCEAAERYDDMCQAMKRVCEDKDTLEVNDRNMLSVAYKNVVGSLRSSWRTLKANDTKEAQASKDMLITKVETELRSTCMEVIKLLEKLTKGVGSDDHDTEVFYLKMKGDYYRYLSEFDESFKEKTKDAYKTAYEKAKGKLPETHPTRLGLALNFSVCHYEILKQPEKACELAKEAFDNAIEKLDTLSDNSYKDSTLIMQLLRDNLTLWTSEQPKEDEADKAAA